MESPHTHTSRTNFGHTASISVPNESVIKVSEQEPSDVRSKVGSFLSLSVFAAVSYGYRTLPDCDLPRLLRKCPFSGVQGRDTASVQHGSLELAENLIAIQLRNG